MLKDAPPGPPLFQTVCQNITMAEFASRLQQIGPVYLTYAPMDATGIEGRYDFTFAFTPIPPNLMTSGRRGVDGTTSPTISAPPATAGGGATPEASEPAAALSLFDALTRQLGLKLDAEAVLAGAGDRSY